jgi:ABC-2 type transport system permease protein
VIVGTIAVKELRSLFVSPLAWTALVVVTVVVAWVFLELVGQHLDTQAELVALNSPVGVTDRVVMPTLNLAAWLFLFVTPFLSMRLIAEERRSGSLPLLFSSPVSMTEIVLGKYVGLLGLLTVAWLLIGAMAVSLYLGSSLDTGKLAAGLLGLWLTVAAFAAVGLFMSTLTSNPPAAAFATLGVLLVVWLFSITGDGIGPLAELSPATRLERFLRGVFSSADLLYYPIVIAAFLVLGIWRLDSERLQG